jgi:hypothetical protein
MTTADKLIRNWLLGFKGPVAGCTVYSERLFFKMEIWFNSLERDRQKTVAIALRNRRSKLRAQGVRLAAQQAMGELYWRVVGE